jgi:hypothetical protein
MSMGQTLAGVGALAVAGHFALNAVLPSPPPISVQSLSYSAGSVTQARTVSAVRGDAVAMTWVARVIDDQGAVPPGCLGSGASLYTPGAREVTMPLSQWVGSAACIPATLQPGAWYRLQAAWIGAGPEVIFTSEPFMVGQ